MSGTLEYARAVARLTAAHTAEAEERIRAGERQMCVACLEPTTRGRWCSMSCQIAEDGIPYEYLEER